MNVWATGLQFSATFLFWFVRHSSLPFACENPMTLAWDAFGAPRRAAGGEHHGDRADRCRCLQGSLVCHSDVPPTWFHPDSALAVSDR